MYQHNKSHDNPERKNRCGEKYTDYYHPPDMLLLCVLSSLPLIQHFFFLHASPTKFLVPFPGAIHGTRNLYHSLLGKVFYHQRLNTEEITKAELFTVHPEIQDQPFCSAKSRSANAISAAQMEDIYFISMTFPDMNTTQISSWEHTHINEHNFKWH